MDQNVLVIGGSFAGFSAGLQLARARRSVLIADTGTPRNRFAATSHGFPRIDGRTPDDIRVSLRRELSAYPTVSFRDEVVTRVARHDGGFRATFGDGTNVTAGRVILAYGVRDSLPDIPGLAERWGVSVLHCPYCHGYELEGRPVGVLAQSEAAFHHAMLLPDWGPTTLFIQGRFAPSADQTATMAVRGVRVEHTHGIGLKGKGAALNAVALEDGRRVELAGLFVMPQTAPSCDLGDQLGCAYSDGPTGPYIAVDAMQGTSVPGVFAAGDLASPLPNATLSAASGVLAGVPAHRSLIFDPDLISAA